MKKILLISSIIAFSLTSCMKNHNCEEPKERHCEKGVWDKDDNNEEGDYDEYVGKEEYDEKDNNKEDRNKKWWGKKNHHDKDECDPKPIDTKK